MRIEASGILVIALLSNMLVGCGGGGPAAGTSSGASGSSSTSGSSSSSSSSSSGSPSSGSSSSSSSSGSSSSSTSSSSSSSGSGVPGAPTANSAAAATLTAQDNALCTAITPFYWEIGNQDTRLVSGSEGLDSNGNPLVGPTTEFSIASASKWIYGTYVVQLRGSAANIMAGEIPFMNFTSGYTNMGSDTMSSQCPSTNSPDTVNVCLQELNPANGLSYSSQIQSTIGRFDYDGGHLENHASLYGGLGDVHDVDLGTTVGSLLGPGIDLTHFTYTEPLLAGGVYTHSNNYTAILRNILSGTLFMRDALGTNAVCTLPGSNNCNAVYSPIPEAWHYSMAHWVEDDPNTHGDGAFSSAGAFGFYPWIEASKLYYGVISRQGSSGSKNGYASAQCGRLIRRAWDTGVQQTGTIPQ